MRIDLLRRVKMKSKKGSIEVLVLGVVLIIALMAYGKNGKSVMSDMQKSSSSVQVVQSEGVTLKL